jgi:flagellar biosynthesis protein FlhA
MDLGIIVPPCRIRDNIQLGANDYVVKIKGQAVAKGETYPEQFLAMDNGATSGPIPGGTLTTEPRLRPAGVLDHRIERLARPKRLNYTVVEASALLATHLTESQITWVRAAHAPGKSRTSSKTLRQRSPALIKKLFRTQIKPGEASEGMQNLLRERVACARLETILETLGDFRVGGRRTLTCLTEYVRIALAGTICKQYVDDKERGLCVSTLDSRARGG